MISYCGNSHGTTGNDESTSRVGSPSLCVVSSSVMADSANSWTVAHQAPLSVKFSRQEYWSWLPFASPWDLPDPGIDPMSLGSPTLAGRFFTSTVT